MQLRTQHWVGIGFGVFILARLSIEVVRVVDTSTEDPGLAIAMLTSTSILALSAVAFYVLVQANFGHNGRERHSIVLSKLGPEILLEVAKERRATAAHREVFADAPEDFWRSGFLGRNFLISMVGADAGLEFWTGASEPGPVRVIPWSEIDSIEADQVAQVARTWHTVKIGVRLDERVVTIEFLLYEIGKRFFRPMKAERAEETASRLRALRSAHVQ